MQMMETLPRRPVQQPGALGVMLAGCSGSQMMSDDGGA